MLFIRFDVVEIKGFQLQKVEPRFLYLIDGVTVCCPAAKEVMNNTKLLLKRVEQLSALPGNRLVAGLFEKDVIDLLDRLHDRIDLASWEIASRQLFETLSDGRRALDLKALKIDELDELIFYPCEFRLLKKLCLKDDYSFAHSLKVTAISLRAAHMLDLDRADRYVLAKAAALHDVGKAGCDPETGKDCIDDYLLKSYSKAAASDQELAVLKQHVTLGVRALESAYKAAGTDGATVIEIIARHHERADGSGYPFGIILTDSDILPQILAFADTIEAMTAPQRRWQKTCTFEEIRHYFNHCLKDQFSQQILDLVLDDAHREMIRQEVEESDQVTGKIFIDL